MSTFNNGRDRLGIRGETSRVLAEAIDGYRQNLPIDKGTLSRYCDGSCANPLEMVVTMIRALPADQAARLAVAVEDAFEDAHGEPDDAPLEDVWREMDAKDGGEDRERMDVALSGFSCIKELSEWLGQSSTEISAKRRARRAAVRRLAEMRGRKAAKVNGWRAAAQRQEVGS